MDVLVAAFDALIDEAAVDFVGTGDVRAGNREEDVWRKLVEDFREQLIKRLAAERKD